MKSKIGKINLFFGDHMENIPIPYFGMIMSLFVAPLLTFSFIAYMKKTKAEVEKLKYKKEILELEVRKEELHCQALIEENKKCDNLIKDIEG